MNYAIYDNLRRARNCVKCLRDAIAAARAEIDALTGDDRTAAELELESACLLLDSVPARILEVSGIPPGTVTFQSGE